MFKSLIVSCCLLLLCLSYHQHFVIGKVNYKPIFVQVCSQTETWVPILKDNSCNENNYTLQVPVNTRVSLTGQSFFDCGKALFYPVSAYGMQGKLRISNLCAMDNLEFRGGDRVILCKNLKSLNVYPKPNLTEKANSVLTPGQVAIVLSDPVKTEQGVDVTMIMIGNTVGWVQTESICFEYYN